jgi:L-alanine-DL-glutamate epimerase-like enolase superfamily enzyme
LRIERTELVPFALPFREQYVTARGRLEERELLLLRLHAEGAVGIGEAAPLLLRGGAGLSQIALELERACRPVLEAGEPDLNGLVRACARQGVSPPTLAAVEIALLDLAGKLRGEPVWRLLGAARSAPVECNATLVAGDPAAVADNALRWSGRGFRTFKLKVGVEGDVEQVRAVREALPAGARLRVDANGVWTCSQATAKLRALEPLGLELAEQPVATLAEMSRLRNDVKTPLVADESVATIDQAREAASAAACDAATVKLAKVGGVGPALAIARVLPVYLSSALDGPVGIAAAAHTVQALPDGGFAAGLAHGLATAELFAADVAAVGCELAGAALTIGEAPGLGVEIDDDALERVRIRRRGL